MDYLNCLVNCNDDEVLPELKRMFDSLSLIEMERQLNTVAHDLLLESFITICKRICKFNEDDKNYSDNLLDKLNIFKDFDVSGSEQLILEGLLLPLNCCSKICLSLIKNIGEDYAHYIDILRAAFAYLENDELSLLAQSNLLAILENKPKLLIKALPEIKKCIQDIFETDPSVRISIYEIILRCSYNDSSVLDNSAYILENMTQDCLSMEDVLMQQATIQILLDYTEKSRHASLLISSLGQLNQAFELVSSGEIDFYAQRGYIQLCSVLLVAGRGVIERYFANYVEDVLTIGEKTTDKLVLAAVIGSFSQILRNSSIFTVLLEDPELIQLKRLASMSFIHLKSSDSYFMDVDVMVMYQNMVKFNESAHIFFRLVNSTGNIAKILTQKCSSLEDQTSTTALCLIREMFGHDTLANLLLNHVVFQEYMVNVILGKSLDYNECKYEVVKLLVNAGFADLFEERRQKLIDIYNGGALYNPYKARADLDYNPA